MDIWFPIIIIAVSGIVLGALYLIIYFHLAEAAAKRSGITEPVKLAEFKDSYTKTLAQIIGGVAVVATFAWTFIKDSRTLEQTGTQNANQQFIDAVKLLGQPSAPDIAAAGVFSFKKLVDANPEYYPLVHRTLMSFISAHQSDADYPNGGRPPRVVQAVSAATYVLGALPPQEGPLSFVDYYISGADFSHAVSLEKADFRNAKIYGVNFTSADLTGANFNGAAMADWASYGWANGAWDDRMGLVRSGDEGKFTQLLWQDERFRYIVNFESATLTGAHFDNTAVDGANFHAATLSGATFAHTDISRADFTDAKGLETADFSTACYGSEQDKPLNLRLEFLRKAHIDCNAR